MRKRVRRGATLGGRRPCQCDGNAYAGSVDAARLVGHNQIILLPALIGVGDCHRRLGRFALP